MLDMPDYFLALNKQYGLAISDQQAQHHVRAVIKAWYLTLPTNKQLNLESSLPSYLVPKKQLFYHRLVNSEGINQSSVMIARLLIELQKTDEIEVVNVLSGVFKSLKIILDHHEKFELSKLLDKRLQALFVNA